MEGAEACEGGRLADVQGGIPTGRYGWMDGWMDGWANSIYGPTVCMGQQYGPTTVVVCMVGWSKFDGRCDNNNNNNNNNNNINRCSAALNTSRPNCANNNDDWCCTNECTKRVTVCLSVARDDASIRGER